MQGQAFKGRMDVAAKEKWTRPLVHPSPMKTPAARVTGVQRASSHWRGRLLDRPCQLIRTSITFSILSAHQPNMSAALFSISRRNIHYLYKEEHSLKLWLALVPYLLVTISTFFYPIWCITQLKIARPICSLAIPPGALIGMLFSHIYFLFAIKLSSFARHLTSFPARVIVNSCHLLLPLLCSVWSLLFILFVADYMLSFFLVRAAIFP